MIPSLIESMSSLLLIIFLGFYAGKRNLITESGNKTLVSLLVNVTLPIFILYNFVSGSTHEVQENVLRTFLLSGVTLAILILFSYLLVLIAKGPRRTILHFSNIFSNTGFLGFPLLLVLYGPVGVIYGSIYNMVLSIVSWSYGIFLFERASGKTGENRSFLTALKNPNLVAALIGLILMYMNVELPGFLMRTIALVSEIASPLSMIVIGITMANISDKKSITDWKLYYGIVSKMIIIPLFLVSVTKLLKMNIDIVIDTIIIMNAMPTGSLASILAEKYEFEKDFSSLLVVITTLLTIVTVPLVCQLL